MPGLSIVKKYYTFLYNVSQTESGDPISIMWGTKLGVAQMYLHHPQLAKRHTIELAIRTHMHVDLLSREQGRVARMVQLVGGSGRKRKWTNYVEGPLRDGYTGWMNVIASVPHVHSEMHWFNDSWVARRFAHSLPWLTFGQDMKLWIHSELPDLAKIQQQKKELAVAGNTVGS